MLTTIISGGQTGADRGGLQAGKKLGLYTGGWIPKGFRTERGSEPKMARLYNLQEHTSNEYPPRTKLNVKQADATLIVGNIKSRGSAITAGYCAKMNKPYLVVPRYKGWGRHPRRKVPLALDIIKVHQFIKNADVTILNVAGNRESKNPGIEYFTKILITKAAKDIIK